MHIAHVLEVDTLASYLGDDDYLDKVAIEVGRSIEFLQELISIVLTHLPREFNVAKTLVKLFLVFCRDCTALENVDCVTLSFFILLSTLTQERQTLF